MLQMTMMKTAMLDSEAGTLSLLLFHGLIF